MKISYLEKLLSFSLIAVRILILVYPWYFFVVRVLCSTQVVWEHDVYEVPGGIAVRFSYDSPDGESGFPGALAVKARSCVRWGRGLHVTLSSLGLR